jgi:hypothetical protein
MYNYPLMKGSVVTRSFISVLVLLIGVAQATPCFCETRRYDQAVKSAEGKINAIDTFKSSIVVKSFIYYPIITYKEVLLFVKPGAKMMKGGSDISIFDLTIGSPVDVKYVEEEAPPDTLVSLYVTK